MAFSDKTTENTIKLVSEYFAPGASLLIDGKILPGVGHLVVGLLLRSAIVPLGPIGYGLVIANSYATSVTGKNLFRQFSKATKDEAPETHPETPAAVQAVAAD
jgi:hypothetical protein